METIADDEPLIEPWVIDGVKFRVRVFRDTPTAPGEPPDNIPREK